MWLVVNIFFYLGCCLIFFSIFLRDNLWVILSVFDCSWFGLDFLACEGLILSILVLYISGLFLPFRSSRLFGSHLVKKKLQCLFEDSTMFSGSFVCGWLEERSLVRLKAGYDASKINSV